MEILYFLSKGCGYKLVNDSKNIKNKNEIVLELGGIESRDCKIQVKSKPAVINALNKSRFFFSSYNKLHIVNLILFDAFPGVTDAFPDASVGKYSSKNIFPVKVFGKLLNVLSSEV